MSNLPGKTGSSKNLMKVLIAYDGSKCSDAAIDDLVRAGLPELGEALVISVAEVWLPPPNGITSIAESPTGIHFDPETEALIQKQWEIGKGMVAEADALAKHAKRRVERLLPNWLIDSTATYGSPTWEILAKADEFSSDLIVVGSQGRSAIGRFVLGSISQKILTESRCSVRVGRGKIEVDDTPVRIMIAFDGSEGSFAAVNEVAARRWPEGSEIKLVSAAERLAPSAIGRFIPPVARIVQEVNVSERTWLETSAKEALNVLRSTGIPATFDIVAGNPKRVLIEEGSRWNSDCIFLGANRFGSRTERFLLGSTSAAVAARASSSVEVVRVRE